MSNLFFVLKEEEKYDATFCTFTLEASTPAKYNIENNDALSEREGEIG